jgi:hypothetical protein
LKKTSQNDITGAWLVSKPNNEMFEKNWDLIFGKKKKEESRIDVIGQNGNDGIHYEIELNKSTGEPEKTECDKCECGVKGCD